MPEDHMQLLLLSLVKKVGSMETLLQQVVSRLEKVENDVQTKISIHCPARGCTSTFTSKAHRNRHIRDWIARKAENEHLWKEHDKVADDLKLKEDQDDAKPPSNDDAKPTTLVMRSACVTPFQQHEQQQQQQHNNIVPYFPTYPESESMFKFDFNNPLAPSEPSASGYAQNIENSILTPIHFSPDMVVEMMEDIRMASETQAQLNAGCARPFPGFGGGSNE